jgi:hypothetical protein
VIKYVVQNDTFIVSTKAKNNCFHFSTFMTYYFKICCFFSGDEHVTFPKTIKFNIMKLIFALPREKIFLGHNEPLMIFSMK